MLSVKQETKQHLDALIAKYKKKYKIEGLAISVQEGTTPIYQCFKGQASPGKEVDGSVGFMIGSTTKVFTALAILQLKDAEKLDLDDPITKHLKNLSIQRQKDYAPITIKHLLMHTSGLPGDDLKLMFEAGKPQKEILNRLKHHTLINEPGVMFAYSNIGYALLGLIVEQVSGLSYKDYLDKHIFKPLDIAGKILETKALRDKETNNIAASYDNKGNVVEDPLSVFISAGSSTYVSLEDMQKLAGFFLNKNEPQLLKPETFKAMVILPEEPHIVKNESRVGLGVRFNYARYNHKDVGEIYGHGGNTFYHHSLFDIIKDHNLAVNMLNNSKQGAKFNNKIMPEIIAAIMKDKGIDIPESLDQPSKAIPKDKAQRLAKDMVMIGNKLPLRLNKNQELTAKLSFLKFNLEQCEDGLLKPVPRGIAKLKPFKKRLSKFRFLPKTINEEDMMLIEVSSAYKRMLVAAASAYRPPKIPQVWQDATGRYTPLDENIKALITGIKLVHKKNDLILTLKTPESSNAFYLEPLDAHHAIIQGYGRGTKETIVLSTKNNKPMLSIQGLDCARK